ANTLCNEDDKAFQSLILMITFDSLKYPEEADPNLYSEWVVCRELLSALTPDFASILWDGKRDREAIKDCAAFLQRAIGRKRDRNANIMYELSSHQSILEQFVLHILKCKELRSSPLGKEEETLYLHNLRENARVTPASAVYYNGLNSTKYWAVRVESVVGVIKKITGRAFSATEIYRLANESEWACKSVCRFYDTVVARAPLQALVVWLPRVARVHLQDVQRHAQLCLNIGAFDMELQIVKEVRIANQEAGYKAIQELYTPTMLRFAYDYEFPDDEKKLSPVYTMCPFGARNDPEDPPIYALSPPWRERAQKKRKAIMAISMGSCATTETFGYSRLIMCGLTVLVLVLLCFASKAKFRRTLRSLQDHRESEASSRDAAAALRKSDALRGHELTRQCLVVYNRAGAESTPADTGMNMGRALYDDHLAARSRVPTAQQERMVARNAIREAAHATGQNRPDPISSEEAELADFYRYVNKLIDPKRPGNMKILMDTHPDFVNRHVKQAHTDYEFAMRKQMIDTWGIQSFDDLHFMYLCDQGKISGPKLQLDYQNQDYQTGILGPHTWWHKRGKGVRAPYSSSSFGLRPASPAGQWAMSDEGQPLGNGRDLETMADNMYKEPSELRQDMGWTRPADLYTRPGRSPINNSSILHHALVVLGLGSPSACEFVAFVSSAAVLYYAVFFEKQIACAETQTLRPKMHAVIK
ncbi:MAG: hypothetical protein SGPRY_004364, partial [Prymnesium sp.]